MRHGISGRKLSRTSSERRALFCNLACSLIKHEQIKTTLPKAKDLRPYVEKLITIASKNTLASRRHAISILRDRSVVTKLIDEVAPRFASRAGGYTRIVKAGNRFGDNAPMAIIELVDHVFKEKSTEDEPANDVKEAKAKTSEKSTTAKAKAPAKTATKKAKTATA